MKDDGWQEDDVKKALNDTNVKKVVKKHLENGNV
jgi:hypothetical protein